MRSKKWHYLSFSKLVLMKRIKVKIYVVYAEIDYKNRIIKIR